MRLARSFLGSFPAFARALVIALGTTLAILVGLKVWFHDSRPKVWLLGDSGIGNYRFRPGERLQDDLNSMLPGYATENWAEPGAHPYDLWLQDRKARLIAGKPSVIVVVFSPDKFYGDSLDRFDEDGTNLRWVPWNQEGIRFLRRLDASEFDKAMAEQFDVVFFAIGDLTRAFWLRYVQWPWERRRMLEGSRERGEKILERTIQRAADVEGMNPGDDASFESMPRSRDMEQVIGFWKHEGIPVLVVLHPYGNPHLLARTWSSKALAHRDSIHTLMRRWLDRRAIEVLDLNEPARALWFPDSSWDDDSHIKDPITFHRMAEWIAQRIASIPTPDTARSP